MALGDKMIKGVAWSAIERISIQTIQLIVTVFLARILTPTEYGTIGILYVFIAISMVFIDSGFSKALIQKKNRTENDISTVFLFNIFVSLFVYLILYFTAPFISIFFETSELTLLLRVLALSLIINAIFTVPTTLYTIKFDFKNLTKINFVATIISGIVAIIMAKNGYGVWSLVGLTLIRSVIAAGLTWVWLKWRPNWVFSSKSLREMFSFGSKLLISSLLNVAVNKSYDLAIVKTSSKSDLGQYSQGTKYTDVIFNIMNTILDRVLLPGLTEIQDQYDILVRHTRSIIKSTALFVIPTFLLLAVTAEPLIQILIGDKWLPAVPVMQLFCLARMITIISGININLLYVIGRTDLALRQQYLKILIRILFLIVALKHGIIFIALAELCTTMVHFFINTHYPGKLMKYGAFKQIRDMAPVFIAGLIMSLTLWFSQLFIENNWLKLILSPIIAFPIYFGFMRLFKVKELDQLIKKGKNILKK